MSRNLFARELECKDTTFYNTLSIVFFKPYIHHRRDRICPQYVVWRGNGKPDEVREHHQQEEEKSRKVKAETVLFE